MNTASKYIYIFLDDHLGLYNNPQGIEFVVHNDDTVFVNYLIEDPTLPANIEFGLCYTSNDFNDFIGDFRLTGVHALNALTPDRLWEKYYTGQAEIYCILAEKGIYCTMYFRLSGNKMIVHDDNNAPYELNEILQTPRQFAAYTEQQALLLR
jgi:hypothetical protein